MMKHTLLLLILLPCMLHSSAAQEEPAHFSSPLERQFRYQMLAGICLPDSHAAVSGSGTRLFRDASQSPASFSLSAYPLRFYGLERYELSRFDCAVLGMDAGLQLGLLVGALGTTSGLFDENSAWYIAGAMTALGVFFGLRSSAKDPTLRIRYRWEEE